MSYTILLLLALVGLGQGQLDLENNSSEDNARIYNGEDAVKGEFPFMARVKGFGANHYCGGVLISPTVVLTAAHCVDSETGTLEPHVFSVVLGDLAVAADEEGQMEVHVHRVHKHPNYNPSTFQFDVAALILSQSVELVKGVVEAIDVYSGARRLAAGEMLTVIGWGVTEANAPANHLQKLTYAVSDRERCATWWAAHQGAIYEDTMFCTGENPLRAHAWAGDSGGPLVWQSDSGLVLYGLVSWGVAEPSEDAYDVNTYLPGMMEFINRAKDVEVENYIELKGGPDNEGVVVFHKVGERAYTACTDGMVDSETTATVICQQLGFGNGKISDPLLYKKKENSNLMDTVAPFGISGLSCTAADIDVFQCGTGEGGLPCFEQDLLAVRCYSGGDFEFTVEKIDDKTKTKRGKSWGKVLVTVEAVKNGYVVNPKLITVELYNVEVANGQLERIELVGKSKYRKRYDIFLTKIKKSYGLQKKCLVVMAFLDSSEFYAVLSDKSAACGDFQALETQLVPAWILENKYSENLYNGFNGNWN